MSDMSKLDARAKRYAGIWVDFACNDPDNGTFTGRFRAVHLPDGAIEIDSGEWGTRAGCTLTDAGGKIHVGRVVVKPRAGRSWVGNWCWDAYFLTFADAAKVLAYLKKMHWQCDGGWCELADKWDAGGITANDLRAAFAPKKAATREENAR